MEVSPQRAKEIIEGIRDLACRRRGLDAKKFAIKQGGSIHEGKAPCKAVFDWYFSNQNVEGSVNSKKAYNDGLVRRTYGIFRASPSTPIVLRVLEWSAAIERATGEYRLIWIKQVDERGAKEEMANFFLENFLTRTA